MTREVTPVDQHVVVRLGDTVVADSTRAITVTEGERAPAYYLPLEDVTVETLEPVDHTSVCPWKGQASYVRVRAGDAVVDRAGWRYDDPLPDAEPLRDHVAFYPHRLDCTVDGEPVRPEDPNGFYGGWVV